TDPARIRSLNTVDGEYVVGSFGGRAFGAFKNTALENLLPVVPLAFSSEWIAFLHGRRSSADGAERSVTVAVNVGYPEVCLRSRGFTAQSIHRHYPYSTEGPRLRVFYDAGDTIRVFDGLADPNDPSKFTIDVELNHRRMTLDGQLLDGKTLSL